MISYYYRAIRKTDGQEIHSGTIDDVLDAGMGSMAGTLRAAFIDSNPLAKGLTHDDIDIEMRKA